MRTVIFGLLLIVLIPLALLKPWTGVLTWTWISIMNPHRLTYGFLQDFPVALAVALATLVGTVFTRDPRKLPLTPVTWCLLAFIGWMCLTSAFATNPDQVKEMFSKVMKIQLMLFVTLLLLHTRQQIQLFVWVMVGSLAFYGIKGGIYTIETAGHGRVWGPDGSFIAGNNELALALTMTVPLMYYLRSLATKAWMRWAWAGGIVLTALCILGSQSRGALLAIAAMAVYLWRHSDKKIRFGLALVVVAAALLSFMPSTWEERMRTIETYEQDNSAMGRINAWWMAYNLASDRFLGGGFDAGSGEMFAKYAPNPLSVHAAHSIYFQVLGDHGFVGLGLFLLFWVLTWRAATWVRRNAQPVDDMQWAARLASMIQVSLAGYFVGGAFLSLAYFDLPYDLMATVVMLKVIVQDRVKARAQITRDAFPGTSSVGAIPSSRSLSAPELKRLRANGRGR
jgi:probable O-glycosylation ligase (exosortase A-associated)